MDSSKKYIYTPNLETLSVDIIEELANELSYNYLANSFGDDEFNHTQYNKIIDFIDKDKENLGDHFNERKIKRRRCRNILLIGAGASYDAYNGVPLGQQLVNSFSEIFVNQIKSISFLSEKYETEKKEIEKLLYGAFDFENFLALLSNHFVTQTTLREEIKNHTGFRYSPNLFYEIVAHMLKHSFLDVVVNFNFDEMLDQAINEELGEENYHFVLSDGHTIKIEDILVGGRIKAPVYMKPHGTFSHKSSLRFTKRHYLDVPIDVKEMLEGLLSGYRGEGKEVERVNLICVGFDLASIEFNDLLNEHLSSESRIYHFFYDDNLDQNEISQAIKNRFDTQLSGFTKRAIASGSNFQKIYRPINIKNFNKTDSSTNEITSSLAEIFSVLWRRAYFRFNKFNRPRSIARHEMISYLFYDKSISQNYDNSKKTFSSKQTDLRSKMREYFEESPKYFRDRVLVEVAIELLRNNGNVDIVEVLKGRTGHFYEKYLQSCKEYSNKIREIHSIYDFLAEFSHEGSISEDFKRMNDFPNTKLTFRILPYSLEKLLGEIVGDIEMSFKSDILNNFIKPISKYFAPQAKSINEEDISSKIEEETKEFIGYIRVAVEFYYSISPLAVTILCNLLRSDLLSSKIRENLLRTYKQKVHNGLVWDSTSAIETKINEETGSQNSLTNYSLLQELFRIFTKTNASSYFNIRSKKNDSRYRIWESFQLKNVLHTNLLLSNDFKYTFINKNWDCLLTVFEAGETIKGIFKENKNDIEFISTFRHRAIILLCCYEAVEQLHLLSNKEFRESHISGDFYKDKRDKDGNLLNPRQSNTLSTLDDSEKYKIEVLAQLHKEYLCSDIEDIELKSKVIEGISIVFVPFREHNQHCSVFIKSVDPKNEILENSSEGLMLIKPKKEDTIAMNEVNENEDNLNLLREYNFLFEGGYHMYRKGFSNNLNPVRLGLKDISIPENYIKRDIDKLLLFYFNVLCRGIMFQVQNAPQMQYKPEFVVRDLVYHRSWSPEEFFNRMQIFMSNVYTYMRGRTQNK